MAMLNKISPLMTFLLQLSVITIIVCNISQAANNSKPYEKIKGLEFRMIHIDSRDSPMYQAELTSLERINRMVAISDSRLRYLSKNTTHVNVSRDRQPDAAGVQVPVGYFGAAYYVEVGIGSIGRDADYHLNYLMLDTGGALIWTQCEGCDPCFYQTSSYFPWTRSSTYKKLECDQDDCITDISYADGATVKFVLASEAFILRDPFGESSQYIDGIVFGCATKTTNFEQGMLPNNVITGILGMSANPYSLISQLGDKVDNQFSYCLQNPNQIDTPTLLRFGSSIRRPPIMSVTPFATLESNLGYHVDLIDISVNGRRLNIPKHLFDVKPDNSGGTIIDSGASLTYIASDAFDIVVQAIETYIADNNDFLRKDTTRTTLLDVCWESAIDSPSVHFPTMTYHFQNNADMFIQPTEVIQPFLPLPGVPLAHPGLYYCLTIKRIFETSVIGAIHQVNQMIIYDLGRSELSFAAADCSNLG